MKKLAFEYAGSFNMPSLKLGKIEKENIMFAGETPTSVFNYNAAGSTFDKVSLALGSEIDLASTDSPAGSAV